MLPPFLLTPEARAGKPVEADAEPVLRSYARGNPYYGRVGHLGHLGLVALDLGKASREIAERRAEGCGGLPERCCPA